MNLSQGDIVLVPFPFTDGLQSKVRPAIVISADRVNNSKDIILAQISSASRNDEFSFFIQSDMLDSPLDKESQVRSHKIFILEQKLILKVITRLKKTYCKELISRVKSLLDY
jgi:mRNA interferase MazF